MCGYSFLASPLSHGVWVALAASLITASGVMLLLVLILERRWLEPKDMALAFTFGDPALAVGIASGIRILGTHRSCVIIGPVGQLASGGAWLVFGLWQWRAELTAKIYTRQQALSPTKIWHQVVIYPALGPWSFLAFTVALTNVGRNPEAVAVMMTWLTIWAGTLV